MLGRSRWSDDSGNETIQLHVWELGDDGLIAYDGRFDEDDFEGAYRELERRYFAGEGAEFAEAGARADRLRHRQRTKATSTGFSSTSVPPTCVIDESIAFGVRRSFGCRACVAASRNSPPWSPRRGRGSRPCAVCRRPAREPLRARGRRARRRAVRVDATHRVARSVTGSSHRCASSTRDEEDAAFAYAEERVRAITSRLAVAPTGRPIGHRRGHRDGTPTTSTRSSRAPRIRWFTTIDAGSAETRSRASPLTELLSNASSMQYSHFEGRTLAVRGERLALGWQSLVGRRR